MDRFRKISTWATEHVELPHELALVKIMRTKQIDLVCCADSSAMLSMVRQSFKMSTPVESGMFSVRDKYNIRTHISYLRDDMLHICVVT